MNDKKKYLDVELSENEEANEDTLAELSNGKGEDDEQ